MKTRTIFPSKYLKVDDLEDMDLTLTIKHVSIELFGEGETKQTKLVVYFEETDKGFVCNKTNMGVVEKLYGDETDNWKGQKITLWANHDVEFKGEVVSAIRVRSRTAKGAA